MAKRRNKTQQLEDLINVVRFSLIKIAMKSKKMSKHMNCPCIQVPDELAFNLDGGRWLDEIIEEGFIDNSGYHYSFSVLTAEQLCELADNI
jgi:hypothetical protein